MESVNERQNQWKVAIAGGIINIIIGVLLVIFKGDSLNVILIIAGVLLAINGAFAVFAGIKDGSLLPIILGGILAAIGIALIVLPGLFSNIFMVLLAILLIIMGITGAITTFDKREGGAIGIVLSIIIAVAMVAAGILILFNLGESADWLMIVTGIIMIVSGALNVLGGFLSYNALRNAS